MADQTAGLAYDRHLGCRGEPDNDGRQSPDSTEPDRKEKASVNGAATIPLTYACAIENHWHLWAAGVSVSWKQLANNARGTRAKMRSAIA
eukprot:7960525-Pyramimonas_sp.AAC.1